MLSIQGADFVRAPQQVTGSVFENGYMKTEIDQVQTHGSWKMLEASELKFGLGATKVDYEVELGVVIGSTCRYLASPADAWGCIAGFVVSNDVSERTFQLDRGGQWMKGKSAETFNPLGPWLVTADEIANPDALEFGIVEQALRLVGIHDQVLLDLVEGDHR